MTMTPAEWEWFEEQMQPVVDLAIKNAVETGREFREIFESMRDEGYIECSEQAIDRLVSMAKADA